MAQRYEFRGNTHRKIAELNAWTKQRHEAALEPDLPILDPHHHVWDDERGRYLIHELAEDVGTGEGGAVSRHRRAGLPAGGLIGTTRAQHGNSPRRLPEIFVIWQNGMLAGRLAGGENRYFRGCAGYPERFRII